MEKEILSREDLLFVIVEYVEIGDLLERVAVRRRRMRLKPELHVSDADIEAYIKARRAEMGAIVPAPLSEVTQPLCRRDSLERDAFGSWREFGTRTAKCT